MSDHRTWDADNRSFVAELRCPHPDCAALIESRRYERAVLRWCSHCRRPFESETLPAADGKVIEVARRARSIFCAHTGQKLNGASPLDWSETGGEPGRSGCVDDPLGEIFGPPHPNRCVRFSDSQKPDWSSDSIAGPQSDQHDTISSLSVVRGHVVAVTRRGSLGIVDADTGVLKLERPLEWPEAATFDPDRSVIRPPAFRATVCVLVAPHEAIFRDIQPQLFDRRAGVHQPARVVPTEEHRRFLGAPLTIDLPDPLFCLWEGLPLGDDRGDDLLRFFNTAGVEVGNCRARVARPPISDRRTQNILWVDNHGFIYRLPWGRCGMNEAEPINHFAKQPLEEIIRDDRSTFAIAPNMSRRTELWLVSQTRYENIYLYRAALDEVLQRPDDWSWRPFELADQGVVEGFAVGRSGSRANAAGQLLAIATDRRVAVYSKTLDSNPVPKTMEGTEGAGRFGSFESPLICSAGVVARTQGALWLDSHHTGWSELHARAQIVVPHRYPEAQGLAIFGRKIFIGVGLAVHCYSLELREVT